MDTNANQGLTTRERKALGQPISIGVVTKAQSEICVHLRFGFLCVLCALLRLSRLVFFILAPLG